MQAENHGGSNGVLQRGATIHRRTSGFTILELLTVIGIVTTLTALLLPAIGSARESARRLQCTNQLKQIGLALHSYHATCGSFPAGWQWESTRRSAWGWLVPLLPHMEQNNAYQRVNRNLPVGHSENSEARRLLLNVFVCPSDITEPTFSLFAEGGSSTGAEPLTQLPTSSYPGVFGISEPDDFGMCPEAHGEGTFVGSRPVGMAALLRGTSNTMIVGERTMARIPTTWLGVALQGEDAACRLWGNAWSAPNSRYSDECEFSSRHSGGSGFLWADGHVSLVSETVDAVTYRNSACRSEF